MIFFKFTWRRIGDSLLILQRLGATGGTCIVLRFSMALVVLFYKFEDFKKYND